MKSLADLRTESSGNTRLLWHHQYWDGAISGIMLWNGEQCWFQQHGDDIITETLLTDKEWEEYKKYCNDNGYSYEEDERKEYSQHRHMKVYRLPPDVLEAIVFNHELFKKYVGGHTDYDINGNRPIGNLKPMSEHHKFYNKKETHKRYDFKLSEYEIIGEFLY